MHCCYSNTTDWHITVTQHKQTGTTRPAQHMFVSLVTQKIIVPRKTPWHKMYYYYFFIIYCVCFKKCCSLKNKNKWPCLCAAPHVVFYRGDYQFYIHLIQQEAPAGLTLCPRICSVWNEAHQWYTWVESLCVGAWKQEEQLEEEATAGPPDTLECLGEWWPDRGFLGERWRDLSQPWLESAQRESLQNIQTSLFTNLPHCSGCHLFSAVNTHEEVNLISKKHRVIWGSGEVRWEFLFFTLTPSKSDFLFLCLYF